VISCRQQLYIHNCGQTADAILAAHKNSLSQFTESLQWHHSRPATTYGLAAVQALQRRQTDRQHIMSNMTKRTNAPGCILLDNDLLHCSLHSGNLQQRRGRRNGCTAAE